MAKPSDAGDSLFESLSDQLGADKAAARTKELGEKLQTQQLQAQERVKSLIGSNSTLPVTINKIQLIGGSHTRRSFLDRLFDPLLTANRDRPYIFGEALYEISSVASKLERFGIFKDPISTFIDRPSPTDPSSTVSDIDVFLRAQERGRFSAKTGTDIGNTEGSAYGEVQLRNIFGGAESLNLNASKGTRTRSSFHAIFEAPVLSDPDKRISIDALASSTHKPWASHEEGLTGGGLKYSWVTPSGYRHQIGYTGVWRQITGLGQHASPTVRNDAGDSLKSSITHTWLADRLNHPFLPSRGYLIKTISEIAGWGPLKGDVAFWKSEVETTGALPVPIPGIKGDSGISLTGGLRAGVLYPLPVGFGNLSEPSRINDRFLLGGPTDVRGFKIGGLGPHDGSDAVGGDIYAAGSLNLLLPFPRVGKDQPLRFQLFANAGRLLPLKDSKGKGKAEDSKSAQKDFYASIARLGDGLPSTAVGVGVVYAHPVARFELNFSLPLIMRRGEESRKGLQFGVGINFL